MSSEHVHNDDDPHLAGKVLVTFNGGDEEFEYRASELVSALLDQAKRKFHVEQQHRLSLFTEDGLELPDNQTLEQAGVHPGAVLVLRQSAVRGGA